MIGLRIGMERNIRDATLMTIRFAAAKTTRLVSVAGPTSRLRARALRRQCVARVANDNELDAETRAANERLLKAALLHFAKHGLDAAPAARARAEEAKAAGDMQAFEWWTGITRTFDRRLAANASHPRGDTDAQAAGGNPDGK